MNRNYVILRIEKLNRNFSVGIKKRSDHVNRIGFAENVDKSQTHLNKTLVGNNENWEALYKKRYAELEYYQGLDARKLRKDAVVGLELLTSFSHDSVNQIDIDKWADASVAWAKKQFGEENVLQAILHMDEMTPHIHFFVTPIKDGKFNAKEVCGGRAQYSHLQTSYADAMKEFGLERGLQTSGRTSYKKLKELYAEVTSLPSTVNQFPDESFEEYSIRLRKEYEKLHALDVRLQNELQQSEMIRSYAKELEIQVNDLVQAMQEIYDEQDCRLLGGLSLKELECAIENYPDKNVINNYLEALNPLADWGHQYLNKHKQHFR